MKSFDRKFGATFVADLPTSPAVYLFRDDAERVLYVGKAKNIRRRLSAYRNASRRKVHRKMRAIVRAASSLEVRPVATEADALLLENELIRSLRPTFNVDGKFEFLYPAIGIGGATLLCFTTDHAAYEGYDLRWYGCFRSRPRAKEAFHALTEALSLVGHRDILRGTPRTRGSYLRGFRQLDMEIVAALEVYLAGEERAFLPALAMRLLDRPRARRDAAKVQEWLHTLDAFYAFDLAPLREALARCGRSGTFVAQDERDALFLRAGPTREAE
ncbi:MAG: nucleotide excision repair endonuclease [Myxococcota bacterium]